MLAHQCDDVAFARRAGGFFFFGEEVLVLITQPVKPRFHVGVPLSRDAPDVDPRDLGQIFFIELQADRSWQGLVDTTEQFHSRRSR